MCSHVARTASHSGPSSGTVDDATGEAAFVRQLRRWLLLDRAVPREQVSISGYWRNGCDDEDWRASKADWNRQIEEAERLAGVA